jgi:chemotaxis protein MotB
MAANKGQIIVIKKKKGGGHAGHHGGAWKVAYADFVTAMMAFFLVMWLMGADEVTKAAIAGHFNGALDRETNAIKSMPDTPKGGSHMEDFSDPSREGGRPMDMPAGRITTDLTKDNELQAIYEELEESISVQFGLNDDSAVRLDTYNDRKGLVLRLVASDFFEYKRSDFATDMTPVINKIGAILARYKRKMIRIEGHTEPTEGSSTDPSQGWKLSTARAQSIAQYWLQRNGDLDPRRIQIAGASHFRPIADNASPTGRAINRRIEITVLKNAVDE